MSTTDDRDWRRDLPAMGWTLGAVAVLAATSSLFFAGDASIPVLRPAQGLLLGMLLVRRLPWSQAAVWLAFGFLALGLGHFVVVRSPVPAAGIALAGSVEAALAYAVLQARRVDLVGLRDRQAAAWLPVVCLLVPVAGGAIAALAAHGLNAAGFLLAWRDGWVGGSAGLWLVLPLVLAWPRRHPVDGEAAPSAWLAWLAALALAVCVGSAFLLRHPFGFIALPLLVVAFRAGVFATAAVALADALVLAALHQAQPLLLPLLPAARGLAGIGLAEVVLGSLLAAIPPLLVSILERQRRESLRGMQVAREQLGVIVEHAPVLIAEIGNDLRYRYANRKYREWFGKQAEDMVGRTPGEVFGDEIGRRIASRMQRALAGQEQRFEITMPGGQDLEVGYQPRFAPEGGSDGFVVLAQDVTWRKHNERVLQELLESSPDAVLVADRGRCIELANPRAQQAFGYQREELQGQPVAMLIPQFADIEEAVVRAYLQPDSPMRVHGVGLPLRGVHKQGDTFPVEIVLGQLDSEHGPLLIIAIRDVTEREAAERGLDESRRRARVVLDSIGDAVVGCDASLRITDFNRAAETLTGWGYAEAIGKPVHEVVKLLDAESGQPPLSPLQIAIQDKRVVGIQADCMLEHLGGAKSRIEANAAPVLDRDGDASGGVLVFHEASESGAMASKMSHLAQHDYLTDLPNRVLLHDRMTLALATIDRGAKGALMFVDLDHFKNINDTLGHHVGDEVLKEVARRLKEVVRDDDTVSRQGGDEFVLLLVRLADPRDAARIAEKLINAIERPFHVQGEALHISASVGIALFPQDGRDIKTLIKQADTALYHAKESGRGRYSYFTGVMSETAEVRMRMEHDLRLALANESFFLVYQPKIVLPDNTITGMEALVRWRDFEGNTIAPADFIPVAEETGLIVQIDEWVMREACRQNRAWQEAGLRRIPVSVNVSLARFDPERLVASISDALQSSGLEPGCLEIEFTESQMFQHNDAARDMIGRLNELGVRVAIDDFGTGYSNLSYLVQYKFDTLKIDRSFIRGLPDDRKHYAVVQAIIGMAHALDYRVVAEGVESHAQAETLLAQGCDQMQGYLYSRPVPADEFAALLRRGNIVLPDVGVGQRPGLA